MRLTQAVSARCMPGGWVGGWLVALFVALLYATPAAAEVEVPPLRSPVTDLTATLSSQERAALEQTLRSFEARKGSQIAVLLVPTTQPETIEQYSIRVAEAWALGRKGVDDGVILIVAKQDRALRIEVGYGLEGALPDVIAYRIIEEAIKPRFRDGDFAEGIEAGVGRIMQVLDGEPLPPPERQSRSGSSGGGIGNALPLLLLFALVGGNTLRAMFGRTVAALLSGGIAAVLMWLVTRAVMIALLAALAAFVFVLVGGGGRGWSSPRRGGYRGSWGGGSGRGGGFGGGFSGGGGGFGGGGASGRW